MNDYAAHASAAGSTLGWRAPETLAECERPRRLWPWLVERESLTARLRAHCEGAFRVRLLRSDPVPLTDGELAWTGRTRGFARDVYLCRGEEPWVYARTLAVDGGAAEARLRALGERSLGDWAFEKTSTWRDALEISGPEPADLPRAAGGLEAYWGRRSVLRTGEERLYVREYFLAGATPWQ